MYQIRQYQEKDRERIEQICVGTSSGQFGGNPIMREALLDVFCHYYIEKEPENCFVAIAEINAKEGENVRSDSAVDGDSDDGERVVGYVLCAENFERWEDCFTREYVEASSNPVTKLMGPGTIEGLRKYAEEYPAHLHIDLDESYQRRGLGTRLMEGLIAHLKEKQVPGLCLCVAADNEKGLGFYRKYGFRELERNEQEIVMGIRLDGRKESDHE